MRRIVVGIDGSPGSQVALRWAVREAKLPVAGGEVASVDVVGVWNYPVVAGAPGAVVPVTPLADQGADTLTNLQECIAGLGPEATGVVIDTVVAEGGASQMLCEAAKDADLLVVGTRGAGRIRRLILGSVSNQVIHHAPCPVALIPPEATMPAGSMTPTAVSGRVVVGVDGSESAGHALAWAVLEGERRGWPVDVVYAWEPFVPFGRAGSYIGDSAMAEDAQVVLDRVMAKAFGDELPVHVRARTASGDPSEVLVEAAGPGDVLVVGTRGHGGFLGLHLGSVATHCAHHTRSPLVLVR